MHSEFTTITICAQAVDFCPPLNNERFQKSVGYSDEKTSLWVTPNLAVTMEQAKGLSVILCRRAVVFRVPRTSVVCSRSTQDQTPSIAHRPVKATSPTATLPAIASIPIGMTLICGQEDA